MDTLRLLRGTAWCCTYIVLGNTFTGIMHVMILLEEYEINDKKKFSRQNTQTVNYRKKVLRFISTRGCPRKQAPCFRRIIICIS